MFSRLLKGTPLDPLKKWTAYRAAPDWPEKSFRERWKEEPGSEQERRTAMFEPSTAGRDRILQRIRAALPKDRKRVSQPTAEAFAPIADPLVRFQAECKSNLTECILAPSNTLQQRLLGLLAELPPGEIFAEDTPQIRALLAGSTRAIRWSSEGPPRESTVATITRAHFLIAQTGSLLVSSENGGRGATVIAPVHIVIAHQDQLVPDLETALANAKDQNLAENKSFVGLVTEMPPRRRHREATRYRRRRTASSSSNPPDGLGHQYKRRTKTTLSLAIRHRDASRGLQTANDIGALLVAHATVAG